MKKNFKCILMSMILTLSLCMISVIPALAANNDEITPYAQSQVWEKGVHDVGAFHMTNTNLTPNKIMGAGGKLLVFGSFMPDDDIGSLALKVRVYNRTKGTSIDNDFIYNQGHLFALKMDVSKGDIIQVFFDAYTAPGGSNPTGAYRKAYISYSYSLQ